MKRFCWLWIGILVTTVSVAQVQSPDQFLGYKLGSRYTPHYKIVNYFNQVAKQAPEMVKLEQYGETNEGRPLLLAYVASKENLANLENIRKNNLRLANMALDKMAADENAPSIVWLSYNVHGNETSSSEAAMLTIYSLVDQSYSRSKEWLKNTVVIIDPCINPDGRDRYVNWFNQVVGKLPNSNPSSREHIEPWPGGRSNHYNFDLNRDWAWQTQIESQQRIVKYNQWMPQVHVDFHEQGYNNPYYFAPAAEPFHEVITPWQREFQTIIGKNNAKYFDQQGWLYFTKERFDLFYPSYGDTYPTYNGAIGMTYEQGGGSRGGVSVSTADGDTLTLYDRLIHHYTTGLATVEITSQQSQRVIKEFHTYFNNAIKTPSGDFKSYLVKADNGDRLVRLKELLDRNKIDWGYPVQINNASPAISGTSYESGKTEQFKITAGDIVINSNQPKSNLVKVLFERTSKLSDSATYDITAWSIPFVYGLKTYGLKEVFQQVSKTNPVSATAAISNTGNAYGYVVRWNGLNSAKFLAAVLQMGVRVRYAEEDFNLGGQDFDKGSLLVTRASNKNLSKPLDVLVKEAADQSKVQAFPVSSGFVDKGFDFGSDRVRVIQTPKVALLAGANVSSLAMGEIWHFFEQQLQYPITIINTDDLARSNPNDYNTLIIPDGYYEFFSQKDKNEELKNWVRKGGKIIALERTLEQMSKADWGIKLKGADDKKDDVKKDDYSLLKKYENRERDGLVSSIPGSIFKVNLDNSHPLGFGYPDYYYTLKQDDNIYEFLNEGWNVGVIKKENYISGFTGSKTKEKLKDGLLFGVLEMGRGEVVCMADNPMFRSFWENGKLLLCNAVFLVGQ